jgi:hypothetical protein
VSPAALLESGTSDPVLKRRDSRLCLLGIGSQDEMPCASAEMQGEACGAMFAQLTCEGFVSVCWLSPGSVSPTVPALRSAPGGLVRLVATRPVGRPGGARRLCMAARAASAWSSRDIGRDHRALAASCVRSLRCSGVMPRARLAPHRRRRYRKGPRPGRRPPSQLLSARGTRNGSGRHVYGSLSGSSFEDRLKCRHSLIQVASRRSWADSYCLGDVVVGVGAGAEWPAGRVPEGC